MVVVVGEADYGKVGISGVVGGPYIRCTGEFTSNYDNTELEGVEFGGGRIQRLENQKKGFRNILYIYIFIFRNIFYIYLYFGIHSILCISI